MKTNLEQLIYETLSEFSESNVINEGAETRNMKAAKHYLYDKKGYDEQQAMKTIGSIKTDIPNSRLAKCKFMLAMVRMFCNGELNSGQTIMSVNKSLKYAASEAHVNEYDNNLNGLTAEQLVQKFKGNAIADLESDKVDVAKGQYDEKNSQYQIVKIKSFQESEEYGQYTTWCVTQYPNMYNSYTSGGLGVFYFCLRNGWQDEPEKTGENCPLDSYGLSMIAVSINQDGSCNTITCRWNHAYGGNDSIMSPKQLSQIIGHNFYDVFKPLTKEEIQSNQMQLINGIKGEMFEYGVGNDDLALEMCGDPLSYDADDMGTDERDFYVYSPQNDEFEGENVIFNPDDFRDHDELLINMTFDEVSERIGDNIVVEKGDKYNFVHTPNGKLLSEIWFDKVNGHFRPGLCLVMKSKKWNIIKQDGSYVSNTWYDAISTFGRNRHNELIEVQNGELMNVMDMNGQLKFNKWFDYSFQANAFLLFLRFDGIIHGYDPRTLKVVVPYDITECLGYYYGKYYKIELSNGKEYYITLDGKYNLIDAKTGQIVETNPLSQSNESLIDNLIHSAINEVRYIDASQRYDNHNGTPYRNNYNDKYSQKPIRRNDVFRVYHGCTLKTALTAAIQGLSGKQWTPRTYSYESGMNPIGLFVTTDFNKAKDFATGHDAQVVLEFSVKGSQLDTPVWNNSGTYFGQGSNPQPFRNAKERGIQRRAYNNEIEFDHPDNYDEYVKKSWNPAMADRIFNNPEHQALFYGDLNPNMIKRFWVRERQKGKEYISTLDHFKPYTRSQFLNKFKNTEFVFNQWYNRDKGQTEYDKRKITKEEKVFKPNDDFTSIEDLANRIINQEKRTMPKYFDTDEKIEKEKRNYINVLNGFVKNGDVQELLYYIWPKQLRQLLGDDKFKEVYDRLNQLQGYK